MKTAATTRRIIETLAKQHPNADTELHHRNAFELLVATILSAQCTDVLVNQVTPALFKKYRSARAYAEADLAELTRDVSRVNFYRTKAKHLQAACRLIAERFGGAVPHTMEGLLTLPGVARKTANVVLGNAFGSPVGVVVDTHVMRLSQRMGLSAHATPEKIERDLMALVPQERWTVFSHQMIQHGRAICQAKTAHCAACPLSARLCPSRIRK